MKFEIDDIVLCGVYHYINGKLCRDILTGVIIGKEENDYLVMINKLNGDETIRMYSPNSLRHMICETDIDKLVAL